MKKERKKINGILNPDNTDIYINQTNRFGETEFSWRHIDIHASVLRSSVLKKMFRDQTEGGAKPPSPPTQKLAAWSLNVVACWLEGEKENLAVIEFSRPLVKIFVSKASYVQIPSPYQRKKNHA